MTPGAAHGFLVPMVEQHQPIIGVVEAEGFGDALDSIQELRLGPIGARGLGGGRKL